MSQQQFSDEQMKLFKILKEYDNLDRENNGLLELWSKSIEEMSFKTYTIPINKNEATALRQRGIHNKVKKVVANPEYKTKDYDDLYLKQIEDKMEALIKEHPCDGYFVRLGTRSPKDAFCPEMNERFESELKHLLGEEVERVKQLKWNKTQIKSWKEGFDCGDYMIYMKARFVMWKSRNVAEMMTLLTNSNRIIDDIERILPIAKNEEEVEVIAVREWCNEINPWMEFRGLVYKDTLTALTQYDSRFCVDEIVHQPKIIEDMIKNYFETIFIQKFKEDRERNGDETMKRLDSYVVDFGILDVQEQKIKIIEINCFCSLCGVSLFDWAKDVEVIFGKKPFEFRFNKEPPSNVIWKYEIDTERYQTYMKIKMECSKQMKDCLVV